jgi:AhpC/TSA family
MTITTVLLGYTTLAATLALGLSLLVLRSVHGKAPAPPGSAVAVLPPSGPEVGSQVRRITALTAEEKLLDTEEFAGQRYLLAFFSSSCQGCRMALPAMMDYAGQLFGSPGQLIAVIVGDRRRGADIASKLQGSATLVYEAEGGPISTAFEINLFPSYILVSEEGKVLATGQSVRDLPQPQPQ